MFAAWNQSCRRAAGLFRTVCEEQMTLKAVLASFRPPWPPVHACGMLVNNKKNEGNGSRDQLRAAVVAVHFLARALRATV